MIRDVASERAVIAGTLKHGRDGYFECEGLIKAEHLSDEFNQLIWAAAEHHYGGGEARRIDYPTLLTLGKQLGFDRTFDSPDFKRHLKAMLVLDVELETIQAEAKRIRKLGVARGYREKLEAAIALMDAVTGDESLGEIQSLAEKEILEYGNSLGTMGNATKQIAEGIDEYLGHLLNHPCDHIGIPTPWPTYNRAIGDGIRRGGVSLMGGRAKSGKTWAIDTLCVYVAGTLGIPVFNIDTEMNEEQHWDRILAGLTGIPMPDIQHGRVTDMQAALLWEKSAWLKSIPYYYRSVIDESIDEQVATMRRWILRHVGTDEDGVRNPCLIAYDYLQMTDAGDFKGDFKEYQLLGFIMVQLTRLAKKYDVPIFSLLQLNREGIDKETVAAAAGSDRIIWKCQDFTIIKDKSLEEIKQDGEEHGNKKLKVLITRHGAGMDQDDYINLKFDGSLGKLVEGPTRFQLQAGQPTSKAKGFGIEDEDDLDAEESVVESECPFDEA